MCVPGCMEHVAGKLSRRGLLKAAAVSAGGLAAATAGARAAQARQYPAFTRVLDLTHTLTPKFPTFAGAPGITLKTLKRFKSDGYNMAEWSVLEHSGTHIDAPIHFSAAGAGPADIPPEQLVVPLAVVDVRDKAAADADYQLSPQDLQAWERRHGPLPEGACVAMNSGWSQHVHTWRFAGRDDKGVMHFPGFHPEATAFLLKERQIAGIAVDTLSLDHGLSRTFKTHYIWLPAGRWGLENVAGLSAVPATGATLMVGAPKIAGATGGPTRVMAMV